MSADERSAGGAPRSRDARLAPVFAPFARSFVVSGRAAAVERPKRLLSAYPRGVVPSDGDDAVIPQDFPTRSPATRADLVLLEVTPANWSELDALSATHNR
jgi:hypothetical protein